MNVCRSCGAPIVWRRTAKGNAIPLDARERTDGKLLAAGAVGGVVGVVLFVFGVAWLLENGEPPPIDLD